MNLQSVTAVPKEEIPIVEEPKEVDEAPIEKEEVVEPEEPKVPEKPTEPPPSHPRFNEVYGKMKSYERNLQERERDIEVLREHTFKLDQKLREVAEKGNVDNIPEPDPIADPDAHQKWRQWKNTRQEAAFQQNFEKARLANLIELESGIREDYDDVIKVAEREMQLNETKRKEVWGNKNPARAAYFLGKKLLDERKKQEKDEVDRMGRLDQGSVETNVSAAPPAPKAPEVSDDEKRIIRNLFPHITYKEAEKKYLEQRKHIRGK